MRLGIEHAKGCLATARSAKAVWVQFLRHVVSMCAVLCLSFQLPPILASVLPCVAYYASHDQVVPARFHVLCCVQNVRVRQHKLGYPLAVHSNVLECVRCTYVCDQVMATFCAFRKFEFVNSFINIFIMPSCLAMCCFFISAYVHSSKMCPAPSLPWHNTNATLASTTGES